MLTRHAGTWLAWQAGLAAWLRNRGAGFADSGCWLVVLARHAGSAPTVHPSQLRHPAGTPAPSRAQEVQPSGRAGEPAGVAADSPWLTRGRPAAGRPLPGRCPAAARPRARFLPHWPAAGQLPAGGGAAAAHFAPAAGQPGGGSWPVRASCRPISHRQLANAAPAAAAPARGGRPG